MSLKITWKSTKAIEKNLYIINRNCLKYRYKILTASVNQPQQHLNRCFIQQNFRIAKNSGIIFSVSGLQIKGDNENK